MKQNLRKPSRGKRVFTVFCFATALLSPLVWLYFTGFIGNPFALDSFTERNLWVCLGGMGLPAVLNLLVWGLQKKLDGYRRGWLFAACCFVPGALFWLFTLGTNWFSWKAAADMGRIPLQQYHRLLLCAFPGLVCALVPLIPTVIAAAKSKGNGEQEEKP